MSYVTKKDIAQIGKLFEKELDRMFEKISVTLENTGKDMRLFNKKLDIMNHKLHAFFYDTMKIMMYRQKALEDRVEMLEKKLQEATSN